MSTNTFRPPPLPRLPPSIDQYLRAKPKKGGPQKAKCPKCGHELVLRDTTEEMECPRCGARLMVKNYKDGKLVTEPEEATLPEFGAEEEWRRDHPDE
jgi:DNA-directed RNA polymerase subunit RPC12/RpoP